VASRERASLALLKLAGIKISAMEALRITQRSDKSCSRSASTALQLRRELSFAKEIACVPVDGGQMRTHAPEQGRGVREYARKGTQVAVLWNLTGQSAPESRTAYRVTLKPVSARRTTHAVWVKQGIGNRSLAGRNSFGNRSCVPFLNPVA